MIISDPAIEDVSERFAKETAGVADPSAAPVVGQIFPPGSDQQTEAESFPVEDFITEEFVAAIFSMPGNIMARKTGHEWWTPDEDEQELLGKGATPAIKYLIAKYLSGSSGPFAALGAVVAVVYAPKVMREALEQKKEKQRASSPSSPYPPNSQTNAGSQPSSAYAGAGNPMSSSDLSVPLDD
jgi:hypothetical protein